MTQENFRKQIANLDALGLEALEKKPIIMRLVQEHLQEQETITRQFFEEFEIYIRSIKVFHLCTNENYLIAQRDKEISENCVKVELPKVLVYRDKRASENLLPLVYHSTNSILHILGAEVIDRYELFKWIFWNCWVQQRKEEWGDDYCLISSKNMDLAKKCVPELLERLMNEDKELFETYEAEKEKEQAIFRKYDKIISKLSAEERKKVIGIRIDERLIKIID